MQGCIIVVLRVLTLKTHRRDHALTTEMNTHLFWLIASVECLDQLHLACLPIDSKYFDRLLVLVFTHRHLILIQGDKYGWSDLFLLPRVVYQFTFNLFINEFYLSTLQLLSMIIIR